MLILEHGQYQFKIDQQVLMLQCTGPWNIELFRQMEIDMKQAIFPISDKPWACMLDLLHWELGVYEMWEDVKKLNQWSADHNQKFEAVVTNKNIIKILLQESHQSFCDVETKFFDNREEAMQWLEDKGLLTLTNTPTSHTSKINERTKRPNVSH